MALADSVKSTVDRLLSSVINSNRELHLPGGIPNPDPDSVVIVGDVPRAGQELASVFFRALADDLVAALPGVPGPGDERREGLTRVLSEVIKIILTAIVPADRHWETGLRQWVGARGFREGGTAAELRERIMQFLDFPSMISLELDAEQISDEEASEWNGGDEEFDLAVFTDDLKAQLQSLLPEGQAAAAAAGAVTTLQTGLAARVATQSPPNAVRPTRFDGIQVHIRVQRDYVRRRQHFPVVMERAVFSGGKRIPGTLAELIRAGLAASFPEVSILDYSVGTGLRARLRPDIVDFVTGEVFEIKPRRRAILGLWQVNGYCVAYNAVPFSNKRLLTPGVTYIPPRIVNATNKKVAVVFTVPGLPGLILYDLYDTKIEARRAVQWSTSLSPEAITMLMLVGTAALIALGVAVATPLPGDEAAIAAVLGRILYQMPVFAL